VVPPAVTGHGDVLVAVEQVICPNAAEAIRSARIAGFIG
jgi:hypothetical protein